VRGKVTLYSSSRIAKSPGGLYASNDVEGGLTHRGRGIRLCEGLRGVGHLYAFPSILLSIDPGITGIVKGERQITLSVND
jgi:hypothetical protein